jgi:MFS family permease
VAVGIGIGAALAGQLVKRIGVRSTTVIGMVMAAFGLWLFSRAPTDGSYLSHVFPAIIPQSLGMGLTFVPVTLIATTNVGPKDAGLASGLFNTSQQVGGALGLAILSTLAADKTDEVLGAVSGAPTSAEQAAALLEGYDVAFVAAAILLLIGAVALVATVRGEDVANIDPDEAPMPGA